MQCNALGGDECDRDTLTHAAYGAVLVFIALTLVPTTARSDWTAAASANLRYDDNVGNAAGYADKVGDFAVGARLSLIDLVPIGTGYSVSFGGALDGEWFDHLIGLRNGSIDGVLAVKKKWGLGAFAPWVRLGASIGRSIYDNTDRNASVYRATFDAGKRLDERWNLWFDYAFARREAQPLGVETAGLSGDVYSQRSHTGILNGEFSLTERTFLNLGFLVRHGDVASTSLTGLKGYAAARALTDDPTFGPDAYAYKLTATTYTATLGVSFSPTPHSSLGAAFQHSETHAASGDTYASSVPEITWDYRF